MKLKCATLIAVLFLSLTAFADSPAYDAEKWYRDSAEHTAIYREIYLMAEKNIRTRVAAEKLQPKQWGVILDIDETVLDNSQWNYDHDTKNKKETWMDFAKEEISTSTPGVKQFIDNIHHLGGYVNLVSNRSVSLQEETEKNLRAQGIYFDQVLLDSSQEGTSMVDKNARFLAIMQGKSPSTLPAQKILAWFGDNIQDFPKLKQAEMIKQNPESKAYDEFGVDYYVLPNPIYGSWEKNKFN